MVSVFEAFIGGADDNARSTVYFEKNIAKRRALNSNGFEEIDRGVITISNECLKFV